MEALPARMGRPSELQVALFSVYEGRGVPRSPVKAVEGQLCTTRRGACIDGGLGYILNERLKTTLTIFLTLWLIGQPFVQRETL